MRFWYVFLAFCALIMTGFFSADAVGQCPNGQCQVRYTVSQAPNYSAEMVVSSTPTLTGGSCDGYASPRVQQSVRGGSCDGYASPRVQQSVRGGSCDGYASPRVQQSVRAVTRVTANCRSGRGGGRLKGFFCRLRGRC